MQGTETHTQTVYYDFVNSDYANDHDITEAEDGYYNFVSTTEPDIDSLSDEGWTVEKSVREEDELVDSGISRYHIDVAIEKHGLTLITDDVEKDIYEFEFKIKTSNYTGSIILDGIVPIGWCYEVTEVSEPKIGTLDGWSLKEVSENASSIRYDGDEQYIVHFEDSEEVVFTNIREYVPEEEEKPVHRYIVPRTGD